MLNSFCRPVARANSRFPTLAQTINNTRQPAPIKMEIGASEHRLGREVPLPHRQYVRADTLIRVGVKHRHAPGQRPGFAAGLLYGYAGLEPPIVRKLRVPRSRSIHVPV